MKRPLFDMKCHRSGPGQHSTRVFAHFLYGRIIHRTFTYDASAFSFLGIFLFHAWQRRKICTICAENCSYLKSLFRVVENGGFIDRLRNGHLEKPVATGLFHPSRSPETAKTPRKVHLRLRFQNLGKPRTAGLCG